MLCKIKIPMVTDDHYPVPSLQEKKVYEKNTNDNDFDNDNQ